MKKDNFMNAEWKKCDELNDLLIGVSELIIAIWKHTMFECGLNQSQTRI